jgi:hypothetical protein
MGFIQDQVVATKKNNYRIFGEFTCFQHFDCKEVVFEHHQSHCM